MTKVGEHITLDIIGTTKEYDPSLFEKVINDIAKAADVTILNISKYKFEPQGFTILALLAESHISFHTFPEKGIISFDFFTCGKVSPSVAIDIIKKEFELNKGGTLTWTGNPKKALINLNTSYSNIQANPSILLDSPVNLSIPVNVNVNLFGELLNPLPEFELEFPNVDSSINNELQYRLNDKESVQLQAISLLATGTFQNDINFDQQALYGNLAESAASIINNILFEENDKLKFGLNYQLGESNPEFESNDELGVTMTTKLSDDILINGKLGVPIGGVTESVIAGDFEIELKLNEDRTLTMKIFNRENTIRNLGEQIGYTQGVGISYKVEFNSFKKLINKLLAKAN